MLLIMYGFLVRVLDHQVTGSNSSCCAVKCNPGKVVYTRAVSPSSITSTSQWVWCLVAGEGTAGLVWPHVTDLVVLHLWAQGLGVGDKHLPTLSGRVW